MNELKNHTEMPKIDKTDNLREIKPDKPLSQNELRSKVEGSFAEAKLKKEYNHENCMFSSKERLERTPTNGKWSGVEGNSVFSPDREDAKEILKEKGLDGIRYIDSEPVFNKVAEATVKIDGMTDKCSINFSKADTKLAEQWNQEAKDNKTDWKSRDVRNYREDQKLTWHERCDTKTMDLVPTPIHEVCTHIGGRAECRRREEENGGKTGEKFDA